MGLVPLIALMCVHCMRLSASHAYIILAVVAGVCCRRYGAVLVLQGAMTLGDLNAFMLYAIYVAGSAGGLAGTAAQVIAAVSTTACTSYACSC